MYGTMAAFFNTVVLRSNRCPIGESISNQWESHLPFQQRSEACYSAPFLELARNSAYMARLVNHGGSLSAFPHDFRIHPVKSVHALFLRHTEPPVGVAPRPQILLHCFANTDILQLDLVAELH